MGKQENAFANANFHCIIQSHASVLHPGQCSFFKVIDVLLPCSWKGNRQVILPVIVQLKKGTIFDSSNKRLFSSQHLGSSSLALCFKNASEQAGAVDARESFKEDTTTTPTPPSVRHGLLLLTRESAAADAHSAGVAIICQWERDSEEEEEEEHACYLHG